MPMTVSSSDKAQRQLWTAEEFLDWLDPGTHADLIDGEIIMHSPVNLRHARSVDFLHHLLALYTEQKDLGEIRRETWAIRPSSRNVFLPDLAFSTKEQMTKLHQTHAPFAPSMVIEVLSHRTAGNDLGPKFVAYEEHGVEEYWIVDPEHFGHRFFRRKGELLVQFAENTDIIHGQTIPGFWIKRAWLNSETPPAIASCLEKIKRNQPQT